MNTFDADELRQQRDNASVLKIQLARLREKDFCRLVIVLEGKEDLPVYENWISRIDADYEWEPIVAKGKAKSLEFLEMLRSDRTGISGCTYFIVDHDYDGLSKFDDGDEIYVLPAYSVENFLVGSRVLDSYLRTELRVVADPAERKRIVDLYSDARSSFHDLIRESCARLYGARNEAVGNVVVRDVGDVVFLENGELVVRGGKWIDRLVTTDLAVSEAGVESGKQFLRDSGDEHWMRGKFLLDFFKKFCAVVYEDRVSDKPVLFSEPVTDKSLAVASLDIRNLASKSSVPAGLADQLKQWAKQCAESCKREGGLIEASMP